MPETTLGHGHLIGKNGTLVVNAISVGVSEAANETGKLSFDFLASGEIAAITLSYIEVPLVIKAGHHGIFQEWRGGCEGDFKSISDLERRRLEGFVCQNRGEGSSKKECHCRQSTRRCEFLPLACAGGGW